MLMLMLMVLTLMLLAVVVMFMRSEANCANHGLVINQRVVRTALLATTAA